ncbi:hydrogen peroxide-inducible genes activator [Galenea microaerophila]
MTLNELKYIVALAEQKNFRKAAEKCFVSQPTLSVAIKKLEDELEIPLFERKKSEVIITPVGEQIVQIAISILKQTEEIKKIAQDEQQGIHTELKVGIIYTIAPYLLPKLIPAFQAIAPSTHLIIEENYTHVLAERLQTGAIDLAILSLPFGDPGIEVEPIYKEPFIAVVPKQHPFSEKSLTTLEDLKKETFLILGEGHCFRDQLIEAYPDLLHKNYHSDRLQRMLESSSLETIRYMVASGIGMTIMPCTAISEHDPELLTLKPLPNPQPERTVALAWRKSFPRQKVLHKFQQALKSFTLPCTKPIVKNAKEITNA